jgi:hypothetical protein
MQYVIRTINLGGDLYGYFIQNHTSGQTVSDTFETQEEAITARDERVIYSWNHAYNADKELWYGTIYCKGTLVATCEDNEAEYMCAGANDHECMNPGGGAGFLALDERTRNQYYGAAYVFTGRL